MSDGRPNIVFVLCDNVGWGDFTCHGGGTPAPRIDKLASEGIREKPKGSEKNVAQYPNIKPGQEFDGYPAPAAT